MFHVDVDVERCVSVLCFRSGFGSSAHHRRITLKSRVAVWLFLLRDDLPVLVRAAFIMDLKGD